MEATVGLLEPAAGLVEAAADLVEAMVARTNLNDGYSIPN